MKKILKISLKILLSIFILLAIGISFALYTGSNYTTYSLKADKSKFGELKTPEEFEKLAIELVEQMTLEEKVDQMVGEKKIPLIVKFGSSFIINKSFPHVYIGHNERLNIPPWVLSDGPRGARVLKEGIESVTTFPVAMARGASWEPEMEQKIHEIIAIEMRANETNYAATPCINLLRHPRWGRAQETYGEDPWHLGEFGVAAVKGIEKHNVMACPKHFALNSIENSRFIVDVELDERTLREVYLPHFKKTIQEGKPASLMSAYNSMRGNFCAENPELLNKILREEWGFDGFVSTDWFNGIYDGVKGVKAGLEVEMPWQDAYSYEAIQEGIDSGEISESMLDDIVIRSLKTRLKYAFSEDKMTYDESVVSTPEHKEFSRKVAEKSMVLLKNDNVLPFSKEKGKTVAVIGKIANLDNTGDNGSSASKSLNIVNPYEGIVEYNKTIGNKVELYDGDDLTIAKELAERADQVILVVGYTYVEEGEYIISSRDEMVKSSKAHKLVGAKGMGGDRESMKLNNNDEELIKSLASSNKNLVVCYVGGSAIDMSAWDKNVPSILYMWYAGMEGGNALANVLYGDVNPSGKLPFTIAKKDSDYPYFNPYIDKIEYGYYHGYTKLEKENIEAAYPFGYGLSYTTFAYSDLKLESQEIDSNQSIKLQFKVRNTGEKSGEEISQVYIGFKNSKVDRPIKLLRAFDKNKIEAGKSILVDLEVKAEDLAWYNPVSSQWEIEKMEYEIYAGPSSEESKLLSSSFVVK